MSHVVTVQTKIHDPAAVQAACQRLGLKPAVNGTAELFSGQATGLIVELPGWQYPVVIDTLSGQAKYDNYGGEWGAQAKLELFIQRYAVEKAKLEARKAGYSISERLLNDGSIKVLLVEGA